MAPEMETSRKWADGMSTGSTPEEQAALQDPKIPWSKKVYWMATSNGCFQPDEFRAKIAKRFPEVTDPEKIDELATITYLRQNFVYGGMRDAAKLKEDQRLYTDMTETPYPRPDYGHIEAERVPESFLAGRQAKGMSRDPAFYISERIGDVLGTGDPTPEQYAEYNKLTDILQKQVQACNTMDELHKNFFREVGAWERRKARKA